MRHRYITLTILTTVVLANQVVALAGGIKFAGSGLVSGRGLAPNIIKSVCKKYSEETSSKLTLTYSGGGTYAGLEELCKGNVDIAVIDRPLEKIDRDMLSKAFPSETAQPKRLLIAKAAVVVVVPQKSSLQKLTVAQVRKIFEQGGWRGCGVCNHVGAGSSSKSEACSCSSEPWLRRPPAGRQVRASSFVIYPGLQ